jgi:hypothetical protein
MAQYTSIRGNKLGYNATHLLFNKRPVNPSLVGRGKTFYVDDAVNGESGANPEEALGTLDEAFAKCVANRGDLIVVCPDHEETVTGVGGITADVAGVTVIGLGSGNQRPRFLMDGAATVTFLVSAADFRIENCVFAAGHADIVRCFNVTAKGFQAIDLEFIENVVDENFLVDIDASSAVANANDGLNVVGCRSYGIDASRTHFINTIEDVDRAHIVGNIVVQIGSTAGALVKCAAGKDLTNVFIGWNFVQHAMTDNDLLIDNDTTANTGIIAHNRCRHADVTGAHLLVDCDGVGLFDNLSTSTNTNSGFVLPAIDVDL